MRDSEVTRRDAVRLIALGAAGIAASGCGQDDRPESERSEAVSRAPTGSGMKGLTLEEWDALSAGECEARAKELASDLPSGFVFRGIRLYQFAAQKRLIAEFEFQQSRFVLIPGGTTVLGYDAKRDWKPNGNERESWERTTVDWDMKMSLHDFIIEVTSRPRTVSLHSFLMESRAAEVGWHPIGLDDPDVKNFLGASEAKAIGHPPEEETTIGRNDSKTRIARRPDGSIKAERSVAVTHASLAQDLSTSGFRFPTSDEWEYACGGGTSTLFRWGDHVPCDDYPTLTGHLAEAWEAEWLRPNGNSRLLPMRPPAPWHLHLHPNAFGLFIASNPYHYELTSEPDVTRGGDGGSTICGGAGFYVAWLVLATAYFNKYDCKRDPAEPISAGYTIGRRVLPLG